MENRNFIKTDLYRIVKLATMVTIGAPVLVIKGSSKGLERFTPDFTEALDHSGFISIITGDAAAFNHIIDKTLELFEGSTVFLTKDELETAKVNAMTLVEEAEAQGKEISFEEALVVAKAVLLLAKSTKESVK